MKKIIVQRKVEIWIEETYEIEENLDEEPQVDSAIGYELPCIGIEALWDTQQDLGPVEVYNENFDLIYSNVKEDE